MIRRIATRSAIPAALAMAAAAALTITAAPAAHAAGENHQCSVNWEPDFGAKEAKNAWNYRSGPSTGYTSRGHLYRGDKLKVFCSKGNWYYSQLTARSKSGIPKGTKGWVRGDGLVHLGG
ncbi:SH3 domain-containing protein [Streptomyces lydicus]|uniref:SH3 domain-containing protein n=1 Tax=Streptomyces lydicus TaxID=47763 RepID=UPI0010137778|nr:SH3 domain-containing protein [Streptomyces lydicus]MCZ1011958.1 SH3 domain-containing protein [Streptomyces lydicus]